MATGSGATPRRLTCATDKNYISSHYSLSDIVDVTNVASTPFGVKAFGMGRKAVCYLCPLICVDA
jgi:hypothetical protein